MVAASIGAVINLAFPKNSISTAMVLILWFLISFYIIVRICRKNDYSFREYIKPVKFQPIKELVLPVIMPQLLNFGILFLLAAIMVNVLSESGASDPSVTVAAWNPIMDFLMKVVFAPFFEEVIFRWYLLNKLSMKVSIIKAMVISSLIFGILHGVEAIIPTALSGVIWCILFMKYKSLFPCVVIHFINNVTAFFLNMYSRQTVEASATEMPDVGFIFVFAVLLITISLVWFVLFWNKNRLYIVHWNQRYITQNNIA
jgi:membrane protease YdiL (CAAX protease family)